MARTVELPLWLFLLILLFAAVTFASHFLFPSVRWFFRRRLERAVRRINRRLARPIEPFKLARRHDTIQRLIYDPEVSRAIAEHAAQAGVPQDVAFERARRYAREIVPSFSATAYFGFAIRAARWLSRALYDVRLDRQGRESLRTVPRGATVVFMMNHRSNMDYVLVTYLAARQSALAYAVGEWARVWPLSRLIRAMGGYFIRRRSRDALYRKVLARYVRLATDGGVTQAMFPEGGLSLDGRLGEPKVGLLKYLLDGFDPARRDVVFVPVALNYDRVLEDRILLDAARTGERRFRARIPTILGFALRQLWMRLRRRYRRFGRAEVRLGRPLSLAGWLRRRPDGSAEALARVLMDRIGEAMPVLPVPLIAHLVLTAGGVPRGALAARAAALRQALDEPGGGNGHEAIERGTELLLSRRMLEERAGVLVPAAGQEAALRYYANSIASRLPPPEPRRPGASAPAGFAATARS